MAGVLGERTVCITDWYHVTEHLWACGRALHGAESAEASAWVAGPEAMLWDGRVLPLLARLAADRRAVARSPAKWAAVDGLVTYLQTRGDRIEYDRSRAAGYAVGSGRVEAASSTGWPRGRSGRA